MSLFFKSEDIPKINGMEKLPRNRAVFLDVKPRTPGFQSEEDGIKYINFATYPPVPKKNAFEEHKTAIVYDNIRPVTLALKIMGVYPISRVKGALNFNVGSPSFLYSFGTFLVVLVSSLFSNKRIIGSKMFPLLLSVQGYIAYVLVNRIYVIQSLEGKFEEAVIAYLFIVNTFPIIIIPFMWYEIGKVARTANDWEDFEDLYYKIAGRTLSIELKSKAYTIAVMLPVLSIISVIITHFFMVDFRIDQVIPYCFLDTLIYMMGAYWYLNCECLSQSALILAKDFQKVRR